MSARKKHSHPLRFLSGAPPNSRDSHVPCWPRCQVDAVGGDLIKVCALSLTNRGLAVPTTGLLCFFKAFPLMATGPVLCAFLLLAEKEKDAQKVLGAQASKLCLWMGGAKSPNLPRDLGEGWSSDSRALGGRQVPLPGFRVGKLRPGEGRNGCSVASFHHSTRAPAGGCAFCPRPREGLTSLALY